MPGAVQRAIVWPCSQAERGERCGDTQMRVTLKMFNKGVRPQMLFDGLFAQPETANYNSTN